MASLKAFSSFSFKLFVSITIIFSLSTCVRVNLGPDYEKPLFRQTLIKGDSSRRIAVIDINGMITAQPNVSFRGTSPSTVEHVVMQLRAAAQDKNVKTVVIKINSPGGGVTASDIIYQELFDFRNSTNKKLVTIMMDVAASGGYYVALPSDTIVAHPSTITGSVGVIMVSPNFTELMDKIGLDFMVYKSGESKDAGSPFREPTKSDIKIMKELNKDMADRFHGLVAKHRNIKPEDMKTVKTARVFTGNDAKNIGLIDKVGYLSDGLTEACRLAGGDVSRRCEVVAYRHYQNANDTIYHSSGSLKAEALIDMPNAFNSLDIRPGHYYLWPSGI